MAEHYQMYNSEYFNLKKHLTTERRLRMNHLPTAKTQNRYTNNSDPRQQTPSSDLVYVYEWYDDGSHFWGYGCDLAGKSCRLEPRVEPGLFVVSTNPELLACVGLARNFTITICPYLNFRTNHFNVFHLMRNSELANQQGWLVKIHTKTVTLAYQLYSDFKRSATTYQYAIVSMYYDATVHMTFELLWRKLEMEHRNLPKPKLPPPFGPMQTQQEQKEAAERASVLTNEISLASNTQQWFDDRLVVHPEHPKPKLPLITFDIETVSSDPHRFPHGNEADDHLFTVSIHHVEPENVLYTLIYLPLVGPGTSESELRQRIEADGYDVLPDRTTTMAEYATIPNKLECFTSERELLERTMYLLTRTSELHILSGYNTVGYDIPFLLMRCAYFGLTHWVDKFVWTEYYSLGVHQIHLDLFCIVRMRYQLKQFSLNFVSNELINESKTGVDAAVLRYTFFTMQHQNAYLQHEQSSARLPSVRDTLHYNNADTLLVSKLIRVTLAIDYVVDLAESSRLPLTAINPNHNKMQRKVLSKSFVVGLTMDIFLGSFHDAQKVTIRCPVTNDRGEIIDEMELQLDLTTRLNEVTHCPLERTYGGERSALSDQQKLVLRRQRTRARRERRRLQHLRLFSSGLVDDESASGTTNKLLVGLKRKAPDESHHTLDDEYGDEEEYDDDSESSIDDSYENEVCAVPAPGMPAPGMPAPGMPAPGMSAPEMSAPGGMSASSTTDNRSSPSYSGKQRKPATEEGGGMIDHGTIPLSHRYEGSQQTKGAFPGGVNFCLGKYTVAEVQAYDYVTAYLTLMDRLNVSPETMTVVPASVLLQLLPVVQNRHQFATYDYLVHHGNTKSESLQLVFEYIYHGRYCGSEFPFEEAALRTRNNSLVIVVWSGRRGLFSDIVAKFNSERASHKMKQQTMESVFEMVQNRITTIVNERYIEQQNNLNQTSHSKHKQSKSTATFMTIDDDSAAEDNDDEDGAETCVQFMTNDSDEDAEEPVQFMANDGDDSDDAGEPKTQFMTNDDSENESSSVKPNIHTLGSKNNSNSFGSKNEGDGSDSEDGSEEAVQFMTNNNDDDDDDDDPDDHTSTKRQSGPVEVVHQETTISKEARLEYFRSLLQPTENPHGFSCATRYISISHAYVASFHYEALALEEDELVVLSKLQQDITIERDIYQNRYLLDKSIVSSIYGCLGKQAPVCAAGITCYTRSQLLASACELRKLGHVILYIDTDSIMVSGGTVDRSDYLNERFPHMQMAMKIIPRALFVKRKTYLQWMIDGSIKYPQNVNGPPAWRNFVMFCSRYSLTTTLDVQNMFEEFFTQLYQDLKAYRTVEELFLAQFTFMVHLKTTYTTSTLQAKLKDYVAERYPALAGQLRHRVYYELIPGKTLVAVLRPVQDIDGVHHLSRVNLFKYYQTMLPIVHILIEAALRISNDPYPVAMPMKTVVLYMVNGFLSAYLKQYGVPIESPLTTDNQELDGLTIESKSTTTNAISL